MQTARLFLVAIVLFISGVALAQNSETAQTPPRVLIIPYNPAMHLSESDIDIANGSDLDLGALRKKFRDELLRGLRTALVSDREVSILEDDHVGQQEDVQQVVYHATYYKQDTIWSITKPGKDSLLKKLVSFTAKKKQRPIEKTYMNVGFHDQRLIGELDEKYGADFYVFLNEFEIKRNVKDCMDLAMQIHDREIRVHYSVFDKNGKQVHGDAAVVHFWSDTNDVDEIIRANFPKLVDYIKSSLPK